jgi:twitching motility protein PilT
VAALDKLLAALAQSRMDCLVLEPGRRPSMRRGTEEHEITKTPLDGTVIARLLSEVAPVGEPPEGPDDGRWEFEHAADGRVFRFYGLRGPRGWLVSVSHDPSAPAPPPRPAVKAAGRPSAARTAAAAAADASLLADDLAVDPPAPAAAPGPASPAASVMPPLGAAAAAPPPDRPAPAAGNPGGHPSDNPGTHSPPAAPGAAGEIPDVPTLLAETIDVGGSDLHLSCTQPPRFRIDGELTIAERYPSPSAEQLERMLLAITPEANREEFTAGGDTDFSYEVVGRGRFRVNLYREMGGIAAAFRLIPYKLPTPEQLALPEIVQRIATFSKGLVLVVGPTGSGKSTTLAALIDQINRTRRDHILTIEDPVEFVHPSKSSLVHQRQVGLHTRSFVTALRAALREDPDVVMVGELRDLETTSIAITTAETGHLVFGTLHTTSAPGTVERVIEQYPADQQAQIRLMLAASLRAVIAQVLLKRLGGGRVAAFETLLVTPAISNMIREGKVFQIPSAMQTGRKVGMTLLDDSLLALVDKQIVHPAEAYRRANNKDDFTNRLRAAGIDLAFLAGEAADL